MDNDIGVSTDDNNFDPGHFATQKSKESTHVPQEMAEW